MSVRKFISLSFKKKTNLVGSRMCCCTILLKATMYKFLNVKLLNKFTQNMCSVFHCIYCDFKGK